MGHLGFDQLSLLQCSYVGWFTDRKIEHLCYAPPMLTTRNRRPAPGRPPKLPGIIKDYGNGGIVPFKWKVHADAAVRSKQQRPVNGVPGTCE